MGIALAAYYLLSTTPGFSQEFPSASIIQTVHPEIITVNKKKIPFAIKHPKMHYQGRRLRKKVQATATTLSPYFQVLGGLFQILTYFRI